MGDCDTCDVLRAECHVLTCDVRRATCSCHVRRATCDVRRATCDVRRATCDVRRATCDVRHRRRASPSDALRGWELHELQVWSLRVLTSVEQGGRIRPRESTLRVPHSTKYPALRQRRHRVAEELHDVSRLEPGEAFGDFRHTEPAASLKPLQNLKSLRSVSSHKWQSLAAHLVSKLPATEASGSNRHARREGTMRSGSECRYAPQAATPDGRTFARAPRSRRHVARGTSHVARRT